MTRELTEDEIEEAALNAASEAYHDHPSHPTSCLTYEKHYGQRCRCESYTGHLASKEVPHGA